MGLDIQAASGASEYRDYRHSVGVSAALALAGGYLDGFTFVGHGRIFANAMTWDGRPMKVLERFSPCVCTPKRALIDGYPRLSALKSRVGDA
jgi:hypothetical protein